MKTQSLNSAISAVKAQVKKPEENKEPEKSFHQKEREREAADPENTAYKTAVNLGKIRSADFIKSAHDRFSKDHDKCLERFKDEFELDHKKVEEHFINEACAELDAHPYEKKDPAYEENIFRKYKPSGDVPAARHKFYDEFCDAMREKWMRRGYSGDAAFIDAYCHKYPVLPNDHISSLKEFQPKK